MMKKFLLFIPLLLMLANVCLAKIFYESTTEIYGLIYAKHRTNYVLRSTGIKGEWHGVYNCAQGDTNLVLQVGEEDSYGVAKAMFMFFPTDYNPYVSSGSFMMSVRKSFLKGGKFVFRPKRWLIRPANYGMVGLTVHETKGNWNEVLEMRGTVDQEGCTVFTLYRL